jgi:hypothetical protein
VTDHEGHRSATWSCTSRTGQGKKDVYLACRELAGAIKLSLHDSGKWRFAFDREQFEELFDEDAVPPSRLIAEWYKPPETLPGITRACTVYVPASAVSTADELDQKITWLTIPPRGLTKEITILLVGGGAGLPSWLQDGTVQIVGTLPMDDGSAVWVVSRDISIAPPILPERASPRFFRGKSKEDLAGSDLRALVLSDQPDGSIALYDATVAVTPTEPAS